MYLLAHLTFRLLNAAKIVAVTDRLMIMRGALLMMLYAVGQSIVLVVLPLMINDLKMVIQRI